MARILLAEKDSSKRHFLKMALSRAGHAVIPVRSGHEALHALDEGGAFDLLITGIVMPDMDGIALAQKAVNLDSAIHVMFMTGFSAVALGAPGHTWNGGRAPDAILTGASALPPNSGDPSAPPGPADTIGTAVPFHLRDVVKHVDALLAA